MIRKIIHIDEETCNGCGACANACHEGAIGMVDGKAKLLRDDYCDGLGDCLPACPTGAITFVEREAAAYDEQAVLENKKKEQPAPFMGCPGHAAKFNAAREAEAPVSGEAEPSWPAPALARSSWRARESLLLRRVKLLHRRGLHCLRSGMPTPSTRSSCEAKWILFVSWSCLDTRDYSEKLTQIIKENDIQSVTVARMEVPCCGGLEQAAITALKDSANLAPLAGSDPLY